MNPPHTPEGSGDRLFEIAPGSTGRRCRGPLVLRPRINRIANIALGMVYALTIIGGAIGEWGYYIFGSAIEVALLAAIVYHARTWPRLAASTSADRGEAAPHHLQRVAQ